VAPSKLSETLPTPSWRSSSSGPVLSLEVTLAPAPRAPDLAGGGHQLEQSGGSSRPRCHHEHRRPRAETGELADEAKPSLVVSSPGAGSGMASARQCRQASSHARVVSRRPGSAPRRSSHHHIDAFRAGRATAAGAQSRPWPPARGCDREAHPAEMGSRGAGWRAGVGKLTGDPGNGPAEIDEFMREQVVGRVGCYTDGRIYVVPVIFAWTGAAPTCTPSKARR